jgi:hypothetical protein
MKSGGGGVEGMDEGPENIRSEYAAVVEHHGSAVTTRFTTAGLYVTGLGIIASAVLDKDATWVARGVGSLLAWWLTGCIWILDLRSRALYANMAHRGIDIEHRHFGLQGKDWYSGFFNHMYKEPPPEGEDAKDVPPKPSLDRPKISWMKKPLSEKVAAYTSHSLGFDLLYAGSWVFWSITLIVSLWQVVRKS